jgi:RNA polymerase sigma-70 factor (ECF subfamily)
VEQALVDETAAPSAIDETSIRAFLAGPYTRIVAAVAFVAGSRAAAEDAVAEALARAWERADRGEEIRSLPAWVTHTALNLSRSRLRRMRTEARATARSRKGESTPPASEERLDVERALARLPRRQREATVLRYYLGMDVAEVATVLGVSEGTIKTTLHRARHTLATALGEEE